MKLDRNIEGNEGRGKYAILLLRNLAAYDDQKTFGGLPPELSMALETLEKAGVLDWGYAGTEAEFFLIRLKDKYARAALIGYAAAAHADGQEQWSDEVMDMARRAGPDSPWCKQPD